MARSHRIPFFSTLQDVAADPEGKILLGSAVSAIAVGTVVYSWLEHWDWLESGRRGRPSSGVCECGGPLLRFSDGLHCPDCSRYTR